MPKHNSQKLKQFLSYKNFEVSQVYCKCTIVYFNDNIPTVISKGVKQINKAYEKLFMQGISKKNVIQL